MFLFGFKINENTMNGYVGYIEVKASNCDNLINTKLLCNFE